MTRRQRRGLLFLKESAAEIGVPWPVFEKALYHPRVRRQLSRRYTRRFGHPRRVRVLTALDRQLLASYCMTHCHMFSALRAALGVKRKFAGRV